MIVLRRYAIRPSATKLRDREYAMKLDEMAATQNEWTYSASALIERYPVVLPEPVEWHENFREWQMERRMRFSRDPSMLEEETDTTSKRQKKRIKKAKSKDGAAEDDEREEAGGDDGGDFDSTSAKGRSHAQLISEFMAHAAPRVTSADRAGDTKSLKRCLDKRLFLVTRMRGQTEWGFTGLADNEGEPIKTTAERAVIDLVDEVPGDKAMLYTISFMPNAVHVADKRKTFFFRMYYNRSEFKFRSDAPVEDYAWLTRDEVLQRLPERLARDVSDALAE